MISPTVLTIEVLILSGRNHPKFRAWLYAIGAGVVLFAYGFVLVSILGKAPDAGTGDANVDWLEVAIKIAAAVALLLLGIRVLLKPKQPGPGKLAQKVEQAKGWEFLAVGALVMATNFSTLVLYWPGVHTITHASAAMGTKVGATAMLYFITMIPALLPVLAVTLLGRHGDGFLRWLNHVVTTFSKQINAGILFFFTLLLALSALKEILS